MELSVILLLPLLVCVNGHGRLISPPGRSSMWRFGYSVPPNYNDNQLFCGGFFKQWNLNDGRCGVCGDAWDEARENEAGGKYAKGIIVGNYSAGGVMEVKLEITATHKGFHEFRLCPVNDPQIKATQQCLDQHLLRQPNGESRFNEPGGLGTYTVKLVVPEDVACSQCVLQWKWNTGNSYGCDKTNTSHCCIGCGPQEQFYGCADVAISPSLNINYNPNFAPVTHYCELSVIFVTILSIIQILL